MRFYLKLLLGACVLPLLAIAGAIAVVRLFVSIICGIVWKQSDTWYGTMLCWVNDEIQKLRK